MKKKIELGFFSILSIVVIFILAGTAYFFYNRYTKTQAILQNPTIATKEEIKDITTKLKKFVDLPTDEEPTIATVLDKSKLKDQPFFKRAENGDKVIIYAKALKAILYRPSTNRVVDFSVISMTPQMLKVTLYNGTDRKGLTEELQKEFEANITGVTVIDRENAKENNYDKTQVIDLTGKWKTETEQLANLLNGQVAEFPQGEKKPEPVNNQTPDILIILGKNYKGLVNLPTNSAPTPQEEVSPSPTETE
ncbi:hypothetical protein B6D29_02455 [Microgenomates bacterium UTCPR1]|nr:LytR C-terminal domain-containing protein [Patescibacteria group bacterium]OQY66784.1 MAG: hypothetical protein B6D29_02455 [Microgenomates bacterium UTCPR1]